MSVLLGLVNNTGTWVSRSGLAGVGAGAALATRVGLDACGEAGALLAAVGVAVIPPELTEAGAPVVTVSVLGQRQPRSWARQRRPRLGTRVAPTKELVSRQLASWSFQRCWRLRSWEL